MSILILLFVAFATIYTIGVFAIEEEQKFARDLAKRCTRHKWGLNDKDGWLPETASPDRIQASILMCQTCGYAPKYMDREVSDE